MARLEELKKDFVRLIAQNKLAHSYIFFNPNSNVLKDKVDFAMSLAAYLENDWWQNSEQPLLDVYIGGSGIDDMREAIKFLWQKPLKSSRKTLIIPDAGALTSEAQNAILKIAEEPPPHALILLLVKNPEVLLPTLQSRFQKIFINDAGIRTGTNDTNTIAREFLKAAMAERRQIIKEILATEDDKVLENFVTGLIIELRRDKIKNWETIKELLRRWALIRQYNTNKRLQLEAALTQVN